MLGWRSVLAICSSRSVMSTKSNALLKSKATKTVCLGDFFWLRPSWMRFVIGRRAVVVDLIGLKPC
jgi:hypothetical protein